MKPIEVKKDIHWVGAIDWAVRDFHGYETPNGTTYNNYLVMDEEVTLVDTVKQGFEDSSIEAIRSLVDPARIRHLIINHIENDHMGSLDRFMALAPHAVIHMTERGKKAAARFFDLSKWKVKTVKTGDELKTGKFCFSFIETSMLHWPDSMMTYLKEAKLLFSQDGVSQAV